MKTKKLKKLKHIGLLAKYKKWLRTLGYSQSVVYSFPLQVQGYLIFIEQQSEICTSPEAKAFVSEYITYLSKRPNKRRGGGLSVAHINRSISSINKFYEYLYHSEAISFLLRYSYLLDKSSRQVEVWSEEEIQGLYAACSSTFLGQTDRVLLGLYYGCGLRRSEGWALELGDIDMEGSLLRVRRSKNGRGRHVPLIGVVKADIGLYLNTVRPLLLSSSSKIAGLLISSRGSRMSKETIAYRIRKLGESGGLGKVTLHSLRHSIATHLLGAGLSLERVGEFLGHKSLESTQRYTHIELAKKKSL